MKIIWVATTGNDVTGTGSESAPYASIDRALLDFENGDQIRMHAGTYVSTDSIVISGKSGSLFAEDPNSVYLQPEKTTRHQASLAILDADRFTVTGITILQAADNTNNLIGLYVENVENFLAYTCAVSDFECPSGDAYGIYASGDGRIESCSVTNFIGAGTNVYGIAALGIDIIDCTVMEISGVYNCYPIDYDGLKAWY